MKLSRVWITMLCVLLLWTVVSFAESKVEVDPRAKLAASESARAQALQEKASLSAAIVRLNKSQSVTRTASQDAGLAQDTAESTALIIQKAAADASSAAVLAEIEANRFNSNAMALIGVQALVLLGILGGFINSAYSSSRDHKWAMDATARTEKQVQETHSVMRAVEKNTNSMVEKDASVVLQGRIYCGV
jgi:hypothetical protein